MKDGPMDHHERTRKQLLEENAILRRQVAALKARSAERRRTEEALRDSEEMARVLLNAPNDSALLLEPDGTIVGLNSTTARQLGKEIHELVGACVFELFPPDVAELRRRHNKEVIRTGKPARYEDQRAGMWYDNSVYPIFAQGRVARLAVFARDITERKLAEEALRKKTYQQERLLETARHLTASLDLKEVLTRIGTQAHELLEAHGCTIYLLEADGKTLMPVAAIEPAYEDEILSAAVDVDASFTGQAVKARRSMIFNDAANDPSGYQIPGTPREEEERIIVSPFIVEDRVVGAMCLNRLGRYFSVDDLALAETFASYAETALKNAQTHQALQQEVEERNRAEEALRRSMLELQARNGELDAFAHTVAHDLQNPLAVIISTADVLEEDLTSLPPEVVRRHLHNIAQSGYKMDRIIDELLLLAQVRKGEVHITRLDMREIVAEAQQRLSDMIEIYHAEIRAPDEWPVAWGHGAWIEQVWINYLSNAIKYGGQPPRVELGAHPEADGSVRFWVRDNGAGLTREEQARLFTPFTRLDQMRARGQGLGLSIVRRVMDKLGGRVGVESSGLPGQGSVFSFTLPGTYDEAALEDAEERASASPKGREAQPASS
jgi:PAS domain S-box-containing protein